MGSGAIAGFIIRSGVKEWGRERLQGSIYDQGLRSGKGEIAGFNIRSGVKSSGGGGDCRVQYTIRG